MSADLDHVLDLFLMREFTPVRFYPTRPVLSILRKKQLLSNARSLTRAKPSDYDRTRCYLPPWQGSDLHSNRDVEQSPCLSRRRRTRLMDRVGATIGLIMEDANQSNLQLLFLLALFVSAPLLLVDMTLLFFALQQQLLDLSRGNAKWLEYECTNGIIATLKCL
jgi:hypothetical protein